MFEKKLMASSKNHFNASISTQKLRFKPISYDFGYLNPHDRKYVSTKRNPSDDGTRGITGEQITIQSRRLQGPQFFGKTTLIGRNNICLNYIRSQLR